jgi:hypothetical protein
VKYELEQIFIGADADADNCVGDDDLEKLVDDRTSGSATGPGRCTTTGCICIDCEFDSVSRAGMKVTPPLE